MKKRPAPEHKASSVSVTELKARLSAYLRKVQGGQTLLLLDRRKPVAVISPGHFAEDEEAWEEMLSQSGLVRPPQAALPEDFFEFKTDGGV